MFFTAKRISGDDILINIDHILYADKLENGKVLLNMKDGRIHLDMSYDKFNEMLDNLIMKY